MRLRCHPVRIVRYCLLFAGSLALVTGIWQYLSGKTHTGINSFLFSSVFYYFCMCLVFSSVRLFDHLFVRFLCVFLLT